MTQIETKIWQFIRDEITITSFESWVYANKGIAKLMPKDLYMQLISFDYKNIDKYGLSDLKHKLNLWIKQVFPHDCDCHEWGNNKRFGLGGDSCDDIFRDENYFDKKFKTILQRTPWLTLSLCTKCHSYWYIALEGCEEDCFFLKKLSNNEVNQILNCDIWPTDFDNNKCFWPSKEWLAMDDYKDLTDWQQKN